MGREENIAVFQETMKLCKTVKRLSDAVKTSTDDQLLILEQDDVADLLPVLKENLDHYKTEARVIVSKKRTLEAASAYKEEKICVLNFASASNPGGGVTKGSSAQEEALCRCSTLYCNLNTPQMWDGFYAPHRAAADPLHNDDCIYTPGVVVMKSDTAAPKLMPEQNWYAVNVVTCAAPNLRDNPSNQMNSGDGNRSVCISQQELQALHEKRLARILDIAAAGGNDVIILGAFGCGAFRNDPNTVARAAKNVIARYLHSFKTIEFAIYCSPRDERNYTIFERTLRF